MAKLVHKKPCNDCPYRRKSLQGWLGDADPEGFIGATMAEAHMPCHQTVDYSDPDWKETQLPDAPICAGALIFLRNQCKMPRDGELAAMVKEVEPDEGVFTFSHEFVEHHHGGEFKSWSTFGTISPDSSSQEPGPTLEDSADTAGIS